MGMILFWSAVILLPINVCSLVDALKKDDSCLTVLSTLAVSCSTSIIVIGLQA